MDYKKTNAPTNTVTRNLMELCEDTGNIYETVSIIGKRANQIAAEMKNDLSKKLQEFASYNEFFTRKIKAEERPEEMDEEVLIRPCDGKVSVYTI